MANQQPSGFDDQSVRRIIRSVLDSERRNKNDPPQGGKPSRRTAPEFDQLEGTLNNYDAENKIGTLTGERIAHPTGSRNVDDVEYVFNKYNVTLTGTERILAIYEYAAFDDTEEDNDYGRVDWVVLPFGSVDFAWNCQLYNNSKTFANNSAKVKLLKADGTPHGTDVDAYDPLHQFSSGGSMTAYGKVALYKDFETGASRLEFTHLEGPALIICATLTQDLPGTGTGGAALATVNSHTGIGWWRANPGSTVVITTCCGGTGGGTAADCGEAGTGTKVLAVLDNPDTTPLSYKAIVPPEPGQANVKYGIVTEQMPQAVHSGEDSSYSIDPDSALGECILLEYEWVGSEWKLNASGTLPAKFINPYKMVPIKVGKVVFLTGEEPILPGVEPSETYKPPIGRYAEVHDYLEALQGWNSGTVQVLYHDASGIIRWDKTVCGTGT